MATPITLDAVADLRDIVSGVVLARGDAGIGDEAACFNTAIVHDPDVVGGATTAEDVVAAVHFAGQHGVPVFVQATGHGAFAPITSGVLISTRRMSGVSIDAGSRIATIDAGTRWGEVVEAAARYGLAPLPRPYGFPADWARGFTVVTADGRVVRATADENADLFWALRGGKGGLG